MFRSFVVRPKREKSKCFKINRPTKAFISSFFFLELFIPFLHPCRFPACCFLLTRVEQ